MEVHAHTHTPRKKWTHYFWEFLMLFLAITLGFFVENQRENYIENHRAKEFAKSLIQDLQNDKAAINVPKKSAGINSAKRQVADSVSSYYNSLFELDGYNEVGVMWSADYAKAIGKIFDGGDLLKIIKEKKEQLLNTEALLTEDKLIINELLTSAGYFYGALSLNENLGTNRSKAAQRLIELIKKEYRL